MKRLTALIILLNIFYGFAQTRQWKTETSEDENVIVKSEIVKTKKGKHIYYIAETTRNISLEQAENYLRNSNNHKSFLENTTISKEVKKTFKNEWLTYYYFDAPWPMPNSDAVLQFKLTKTDNTLSINGTSMPDAYEKKEVKRMKTYNITYHFEKINASQTKLTITADFVPTGSVPKWLMNGWFPEGPAGIASRLVDEAIK